MRRLWTTAAALVVLCALAPVAPQPAASAAPAARPATALDALAALPVKGRAPMTGYSRDQFGQTWADVDRNGCDTRTDILVRDLVERQMANRCKVLSGVLYPDPYTGRPLTYVRGKSLVDIDHVVALGNAWVTGAQQLTVELRTSLANDPLNLLAVSASANRQKGDGDAATWLPSNRAYRCAYVARQLAVKVKYGLWVTAPEREAIVRVLTPCPAEPLPSDGTVPSPAPSASPSPTPTPPATPAPQPSTGAAATRYANCTAARAAGVTPIRRDMNPALYAANEHLDRDHDGIACE